MSKKQLTALFLCSLIPWVLGNGLLPLLPIYASMLGASPGLVGAYLSISYLALALGSLSAGWLSERFQRRKLTLILSSVLNIPAIAFMGQVSNVWQLTILTAFVWFLGGLVLTLIMILAGLFAEQGERGRVFGILALTSALGALLGGLAVGSIADHWGYPVLFASLAGFASLLPLFGLLLRDKPTIQPNEMRSKQHLPSLGWGFYLVLLASILSSVASFVGRMGTSLAMHELQFLSAAISSTAAVGGLVALPLSPVAGRLSDRVNRKLLLMLCFLAGACGMVILANSIVLWHFWLAAGVLSIQGFVSSGIGSALVTDLLPKEALGKGLALYSSTVWIGGMIGFGTAGAVIQNYGIYFTLLAGSSAAFIAFIMLIPVHQSQHAGPV